MAKEVDESTQAKYREVAQTIHALYTETEFQVADEDFEILSTIRYDPLLTETIDSVLLMFEDTGNNSKLFFLFEEHLRRINFSLEYFKFGYSVTRQQLLQHLNNAMRDLDKSNSYKLRLTINRSGTMNVDISLTPVRYNLFDGFNTADNYMSPVWNVFLDTEPILISPFTSFKTTRRKRYSEARERALLKDYTEPQEVLLYNTANQITEGSITNVAFKKTDPETLEESWFTPVLSSGCLCGVVRHMLLAKGLIQERQINLTDVKAGDDVLLFNGIMGVVKGTIMDREIVKFFDGMR